MERKNACSVHVLCYFWGGQVFILHILDIVFFSSFVLKNYQLKRFCVENCAKLINLLTTVTDMAITTSIHEEEKDEMCQFILM